MWEAAEQKEVLEQHEAERKEILEQHEAEQEELLEYQKMELKGNAELKEAICDCRKRNRIPTKPEMQQALEARHGIALQQKFSQSVVAVCGLGGLGSNIAIALARAGIGKLILIDFDEVDISNLHRQQYAARQIGRRKTEALAEILKAIAPYQEVEVYSERITGENMERLLQKADIICEAFDRAEEKAMLVNGVLERMPEKYLVAASGMAGMAAANSIRTRRITKRFYLCGDECSDTADGIGLMAARVMVCAAHQAHAVLRILAGEYEV